MTDAILKPCPMCGGPAEVWKASINPTLPAFVACMGRCATLVSREYTTTEEAIAAWNRRAAPAMPADVVTRLRDAFFNGMRRYDARIECNQIEVRADALEAFVAWVDQQGEA